MKIKAINKEAIVIRSVELAGNLLISEEQAQDLICDAIMNPAVWEIIMEQTRYKRAQAIFNQQKDSGLCQGCFKNPCKCTSNEAGSDYAG